MLFYCYIQLKWAFSSLFVFIFRINNYITLQFLQQIDAKKVHPVYLDGIWSRDLQNTSLIPQPLDQGSRPLSTLSLNIMDWLFVEWMTNFVNLYLLLKQNN